jgi:hypothetical protein
MPFLTLNTDDSQLAVYYNNITNNNVFSGTPNNPNVTGTQKPEIPNERFVDFDEGSIRGGLVNAGIATAKDLIRIGKFITGIDNIRGTTDLSKTTFESAAKGILFLTKQAGLQLTNPRLEWDRSNATPPFLGGPTRQFTGVGTLLSVGGNAFGFHFDRAGLLGIIRENQKYESITFKNNFSDDGDNDIPSEDSRNRLVRYLSAISDSKLKEGNSVTLDSYFGGPESVYGIGRTRIRTVNDVRTTISVVSDKLSSLLNGFIPLSNSTINKYGEVPVIKSNPETNKIPSSTVINNSPFYNKPKGGSKVDKPGYTLENKYGVTGGGNLDSINIINIVDSKVFYKDNEGKNSNNSVGAIDDKLKSSTDGTFGEDLIKFRLEFLNNEEAGYKSGTSVVPKTDVLAFRAYLDNFDDGMSAKWTSYRYMGRGEDFYIYDGFSRDIGVAFTMHAHTAEEMIPLYTKLNYLLSTFTPDYNSQLKMRGNIGYLTVGDYIYRQPGIYTDVKVSGFFEGSWQTGFKGIGDNNFGDLELPRMLKISLSFKPIQTFLPRKVNKARGADFVPFIGRDLTAYPIKTSPTSVNQANSSGNTNGNGTSDNSGASNTSTTVTTTNNNNGTFTSNPQPSLGTVVQARGRSSSVTQNNVPRINQSGLNNPFRDVFAQTGDLGGNGFNASDFNNSSDLIKVTSKGIGTGGVEVVKILNNEFECS